MVENADLLTVSEAAVRLRISTSLTYELIRQERLPHVHLGRRLFVPAVALDDWLLHEATRVLEVKSVIQASSLLLKNIDELG